MEIASWPGSSGPSRANGTRKRFQCLARGASPAGDSPDEPGYDSDEPGYDRGEAGYDSGIAMLAPERTRRAMTGLALRAANIDAARYDDAIPETAA